MLKFREFKVSPKVLLRSSWQVVNIGDIAHTPGVLALIEKYIPEAEVILWAESDITQEIMDMEHKRFPKLRIVKGTITKDGKGSNEELDKAIRWCDFLLHGSGPSFVARMDVKAFVKHTGKPFGVFGITYAGSQEPELLSQAKFVYFRDSVSLEAAKKDGVNSPVMEFGPDGAFAVDLRNDDKALAFMEDNNLEEGKFLCCIPRLRTTPYWRLVDRPIDPQKNDWNNKMKEHDHAQLREAIINIVRKLQLKVFICPEDASQMAVGKEMIIDKLPEDVLSNVVWRENFWLPDEALSIYTRSAGLFGNEMHSPIMCIGNGIPAIVCRWAEQTSKGYMWRDIGLDEWLFDMDNEEEVVQVAPAIFELASNPIEAKEKVAEAQAYVQKLQREMTYTLRAELEKVL